MKYLLVAIAVLLFSSAAGATPASPASVEELLDLTRAESVNSMAYPQVEQIIRQSVKDGFGEKALTSAQQHELDAMVSKFMAIMRKELNWAKLKPQFIRIYQETFEQEEIDGLIAFYKSPAGQAFVGKMPTVLQKTMALSQEHMKIIYPQIDAAIQETIAKAKGAR